MKKSFSKVSTQSNMTTVASLQNLDTLHGHRVMFRNKDEYFRKISVMQMDGAEKLNIVSDFDFTMTQFWLNGKRGASCHKVIEDCGLLTEDYHRNAQAVQLKYYPLEVDPTLDAVTRTNYMIEWVFEAHKLLCKSGLTKEKIQTAVTNSIANQGVALRDKVASFFSLLNEFNVPFLIFSAGIADVLEEILRQYVGELNHELVHVISNRCEFHGPNHTLSEMLEPCLHVFNKKSSAFLDTPYFQRPDLPNRTNLLLIGDSLGFCLGFIL